MAAHLLDEGAGVGVEEDDDGVVLHQVQLLHGVGRHVQHAVLALREQRGKLRTLFNIVEAPFKKKLNFDVCVV